MPIAPNPIQLLWHSKKTIAHLPVSLAVNIFNIQQYLETFYYSNFGEAKDASESILECIGQSHNKELCGQSISSIEVMKLCPREWKIVPHGTENPWKTD